MSVLIVGLFGAIYFLYTPMRDRSRRSNCQTNLKQIGLALKQYERDYDEALMFAPNWKVALSPYSGFGNRMSSPAAKQFFSCPGTSLGYAFNINLSGRLSQQIQDGTTLAAFYDPDNGINSDSGGSWNLNGVHLGGYNVGFYDGHVKWLKAKPAFWAPELADPVGARRRRDAEWRCRMATYSRAHQSSKRAMATAKRGR